MLDRSLETNQDHLVTRDLKKIRSKCWEARNRWFNIGIELNLNVDDLQDIQDKYKENDKCFTEMLCLWLRKRPKFVDLTAALRQPAVGFDHLAEEIESERERDKIQHCSIGTQVPKTLQRSVSTQTSNIKLTCPHCTSLKENIEEKHIIGYCSIMIQVGAPVLFSIMFLIVLHLSNAYISPKDCYATGRGLEMTEMGERAYVVLCIINQKGYPYIYTTNEEIVRCEVIHESTGENLDCEVRKTRGNQYEVGYQPTSRGRHQLHIKVEGEHIKGSPFTVIVRIPLKKLGTPINNISGLKEPYGMALNQRRELLVAEKTGNCISIFSLTGEKLQPLGSGPGQFNKPHGVVVDDDGNILVTDYNHQIHVFSSEYKFNRSVGGLGSGDLEFDHPLSIAISPTTKKIAVPDWSNHRVQILNPDLTFNNSIGRQGSGNGQFNHPYDIAFDSAGNMYVTDASNNNIQVFNSEGDYTRQFGKKGSGDEDLDYPTGIYIDSDDTVYVADGNNHRVSIFTHEGGFLTSFGSFGSGPGQFNRPRGITMDENGILYVSEKLNNRIQMF